MAYHTRSFLQHDSQYLQTNMNYLRPIGKDTLLRRNDRLLEAAHLPAKCKYWKPCATRRNCTQTIGIAIAFCDLNVRPGPGKAELPRIAPRTSKTLCVINVAKLRRQIITAKGIPRNCVKGAPRDLNSAEYSFARRARCGLQAGPVCR